MHLHFVLPHVFSTKKDQESTMGFTCHHNNQPNLIQSRATQTPAVSSGISFRRRRHDLRHRIVSMLRHQRRCNVHIAITAAIISQHQHHRSTVHCVAEKIDGTSIANVVSGGGTGHHIRWPSEQLCAGAAECHRWRRSACDCMSNMAMGRSSMCRRTETEPIVSQRNRSRLCLLQSDPLVSPLSDRYYHIIWFYLYNFKWFLVSERRRCPPVRVQREACRMRFVFFIVELRARLNLSESH